MPLPELAGRVVVITGASRGLGAGMAATFAERGLKLGLCARSLPAAPAGAASLCRAVDVRDGPALRAFAEEVGRTLGPIALWINNAGVLEPIRFARDLSGAELQAHLAINLVGVLQGTQAYLQHLRTSGRPGVLVNISSGAAQHGYAGWTAYCAGKAATDRLSECVQLEERDLGLRVYAVSPGIVETDMQRLIRSKTPEEFPLVEKFHGFHRDGRGNTPARVAEHILAWAFDPTQRPAEVLVTVPYERS